MALTGVQIDAIYHTAIVVNNVEYFFGQGIHRKVPGSTHHGRPMKIIPLGQTDLPLDVIEEYIESLEDIYTPESYDLFVHNCNNFSQDLAMFLVGKNIPDEIRSLPETFLRTPIGQMLRGQIDQSMRTMTQAPDAVAGRNVAKTPATSKPTPKPTNGAPISSTPATNGVVPKVHTPAIINAQQVRDEPGHVHYVSSISELDTLLSSARHSCAVIFFTSATCPPCKIVYPTYDELAAEAGTRSGAKLIKIDISASHSAHAIAQRYSVRATPTFITFLRGQKQDEWAGANPAQLRGNVRLLLEMARPKQHQHATLRLPSLQRLIEKPILYSRTPPLDKLLAKIGPTFSSHQSVQDLVSYIRTRDDKGMTEAPLPNLHSFSDYLTSSYASLPTETHFAIIDLVRCAAVDSRVSSFLATEHGHTLLRTLLSHGDDFSNAPYNIQSTSLQLACNLFSSNVFQEQLFRSHEPTHPNANGNGEGTKVQLKETIESLASQCLLSPHLNARSMAAALVYNLSSYVHNARMQPREEGSSEDGADEETTAAPSDDLSAALLESIISFGDVAASTSTSTSVGNIKETLHALLLALGMLLYAAPPENMLWDLCQAMDLRETLKGLKSSSKLGVRDEPLLKEVGDEVLGKGGF
ncbi:hypothetical protein PV08_02177 [Exophiala spinifera]|uniref:Thioredoxin domain-containing protein n=1 Tax=Exophiala spinifera TaxID=91928 RepID=A0A0D2AA20_9EURO|nr:uncharacterized protein PV08_02177 [Exophiala spinifera]KIW21597.1 hypothetical protein PV08_02177 [Exophiala spinifera]